MISEENGAEKSGPYNSVRGDRVIDFSKNFLDESVPLATGNYKQVTGFKIKEDSLEISVSDQSSIKLAGESQFVGYMGDPDNPSSILLKKNKLNIEIKINNQDKIVKDEHPYIKDFLVEKA